MVGTGRDLSNDMNDRAVETGRNVGTGRDQSLQTQRIIFYALNPIIKQVAWLRLQSQCIIFCNVMCAG